MEMYFPMITAIILVLVIRAFIGIFEPNIDTNYETEEKILWFTDPFDKRRKFITLWKTKV